MPAEISCQRVRKVFGKGPAAFEAVTAATFAIEKGEFVCLLGPSGCGKSTMLMMIAGLEAVDGRTAFLAGDAPMTEPRAEIGIVFPGPDLAAPGRRPCENVLFPIEMMRRSRSPYTGRARSSAASWISTMRSTSGRGSSPAACGSAYRCAAR